jgi:ammonia channel protein AmtB
MPPIDTGNTAWMLTSTMLVLLMVPGLAMFYGGLVRTKNVLATMMHSYVAMGIMGVLGYLLRKMDFETAPLVLGVVLAPIIEFSFRQALAMSDGAYSIFVQPISAFFLYCADYDPSGRKL